MRDGLSGSSAIEGLVTDATIFSAGSLFSQNYLVEGIKSSAAHGEVKVGALRERIEALLYDFPLDTHPKKPLLRATSYGPFSMLWVVCMAHPAKPFS